MKSILLAASLLLSISLHAQSIPKVGEKAPDFVAKDQSGKTVDLKTLLRKGPVAVVFYRGYWCPNCNRALKSIQDSLGLLTTRNVTVVAISPETPEGVAKTVKNTKASFSLISDEGMKIIKSYGLGFAITPDMDAIHKQYNIDVAGNNGKSGHNLTRPAGFVIGKDGIIRYAYANTDPYANSNSNNRVTVAQLLAHTGARP
ncbi:MAG: AhpC/TSA family protein [Bacteroidetes bacterium]|nr:AhpC/TSA family protein [Fibrella sp.]